MSECKNVNYYRVTKNLSIMLPCVSCSTVTVSEFAGVVYQNSNGESKISAAQMSGGGFCAMDVSK